MPKMQQTFLVQESFKQRLNKELPVGRLAIKQAAQLSLPIRASEVYRVSEVILQIVKFCFWQSGQASLHGNFTFEIAKTSPVSTRKIRSISHYTLQEKVYEKEHRQKRDVLIGEIT